MCSKCEAVDHLSVDCEECGKREHMFWEDSVDKFIEYLRPSTPFADTTFYFTHLSWIRRKVLLRRFLKFIWMPQLTMDCTKILSMCGEFALSGFFEF